MNRTDLQHLADLRIAEARVLLTSTPPMPDGAYYLAGYAVECALKACIARSYTAEVWPERQFVADCHTHKISTLVQLARLESLRQTAAIANFAFANNWTIAKDWTEQSRYERHSLLKAQKLYDAITHAANGVLPWIKAHW